MSTDASLIPDPAALPDDPAVLKQLICELVEQLTKSRDANLQLEHRLDLLLRRLYGRTSEKIDPRQGTLFDGKPAEDETPADAPAEEGKGASEESPAEGKPRRKGHGRRRTPGTIKVVESTLDLSDAEKAALGGAERLVLIGKKVTEHYDYEPSCLYIVRTTQLSYTRQEPLPESGPGPTEKNVMTAAKPPLPIPGGKAGPGLLAQTILNKYAYHLPLARQEPFYEQHGVGFSRKTLCDWCLGCADLFAPLMPIATNIVLASHVVGTDDTTVKIRDAWRKAQFTGRFWQYRGDEFHPLTVFDYTSDHTRDGPAKFLQAYRGYLQADAFNGYDGIYLESKGTIIEVGCWAHGRRKFFEIRDLDSIRAGTALAYIRELYAIERDLRARCGNEWIHVPREEQFLLIAAERQARSRPVLQQFHAWMQAESAKLIPKHPIQGAIQYALNQWPALCRYTDDGRLSIDNNAVESHMRRIAIGRKNWLFCGSERGARAAAIHYSLLSSCARNGVAPFPYLRELLQRLAALGSNPSPEKLRELLPDRYRPTVATPST
jgi:transposase